MSECPSFLRLNNIPFHGVPYIYFFIHSSVSGHLGGFHPLAIVNNAAINMGVQIPVQVLAFSCFECIARSGIAGSYGSSILTFFF